MNIDCPFSVTDINYALIFLISIIALATIIGFFVTKKKAFGKFAASTLLLILALAFASILGACDKIEPHTLSNLLFTIIGFAGGLLAPRDKQDSDSNSQNPSN